MAEAVIFVGLQGSGKTTYFRDHFAATHEHVSALQKHNQALHRTEAVHAILKSQIRIANLTVVTMTNVFHQISKRAAEAVGTPAAFLGALLLIVIWGGTGPLFRYSDTWQLVVNTATTIVTFLMVFLIQNTQNRDSRALHLKLDELIKSSGRARNSIIDVGNLTEEELKHLEEEYKKLCGRVRQRSPKRKTTPQA